MTERFCLFYLNVINTRDKYLLNICSLYNLDY